MWRGWAALVAWDLRQLAEAQAASSRMGAGATSIAVEIQQGG